MKKFILTTVIILFVSGISIANNGQGQGSGNNGNSSASHEVNIKINKHAFVGLASTSGDARFLCLLETQLLQVLD